MATIRQATTADAPGVAELLLVDADERHAHEPALWPIAANAASEIEAAFLHALTAERQPFRQFWQVAVEGRRITAVIHAMMLPVPPIYAGPKGAPGLILADSRVAPDASEGTTGELLDAAEAALREAGAQIILAAYVTGSVWKDAMEARAFRPLTRYMWRHGLEAAEMPPGIREAGKGDIAGLVARSAEHRRILEDIDPFWTAHPQADARFSSWMTQSLSFRDRDMFVAGLPEAIGGYVVAQPASRLHFPPAHGMAATGVIDDFFHVEFGSRDRLANGGAEALDLLRTAEAALSRRGRSSAFVVCPADWPAKVALLEGAGYHTAMLWSIRP
jgi:predicted N-acetyltransferase YhbS